MKHRAVVPVVLFAAIAAGALVSGQAGGQAPAAEPQQPPITFRAEVNYVEVDARVVDGKGAFVSTLKPGDVQVFEDGKPQQVSVMSLVNIPVERAERPLFASRPIEADVRSNREGAGRVYLLVLDDLHTNVLRSSRVKATARQFIERYLGANDTAAVVFTSGRTDASQDFTNSPQRLLRAVDKFMGRKVRSATLNRIDQESMTRATRQQGDRIDDIDDRERGFQARASLDTIKNLSEYLGGIRGRRKALVLFSEGIDYDINDVFNNQDATTIMDATRALIASATRANVAVYGVDPRGLTTGGDDDIQVQAYPDDTTLGITSTSLYNEVRLGQDSLRVLSTETGGFAVVSRNDFATAFQRIVDDNSAYYMIGYYASNEKRDGRFRKIEVRVPDHPGYVVRARKGYVAPRGKAPDTKGTPGGASPELRDALSSPLPLGGLSMATTAVVFKGPAPNGSVTVSTMIRGTDLPFVEKNGTVTNDLEFQIVATDEKGKSFPTDRNTVNLAMKPETAARVAATGFRFVSSLDLAPGRYVLRVSAREGNGKKAGSVIYDLDVPDFAKQPLSISSLAITSAVSSAVPTVRPKDPLEKLLPGPLSTYREFPVMDELAFFAEVYETAASQSHKVDLLATVKAEGGQSVFQAKEQRDSSELAGSSGGYGFSGRVPLRSLAPGLYVLRVEATSTLGNRPMAERETVFRVLADQERPQ